MLRLGMVILAVFVTAVCSAERQVQAGAVSQDSCIPSGWNATDLADELFEGAGTPADARILVWEVKEDDRPLYVEQAILWLRWGAEGAGRWMLVNAYRHPKDLQPLPHWAMAEVFDAPGYAELREFDHPPDNAEVYQFLEDTWWTFEQERGWTLLHAAVCADVWSDVIGEAPTRFYDDSEPGDKGEAP